MNAYRKNDRRGEFLKENARTGGGQKRGRVGGTGAAGARGRCGPEPPAGGRVSLRAGVRLAALPPCGPHHVWKCRLRTHVAFSSILIDRPNSRAT